MLIRNILIFKLLASATAQSRSAIPHERRDTSQAIRADHKRVEAHVNLPVRIGLRSNARAQRSAESWLMSVSDPDSKQFGKHWSQEDVIEAFRPEDETLRIVTEWLEDHGISSFTHSDNKLWFAFDASAGKLESMLRTEYFEHHLESGEREVTCDRYYLPEHLKAHIDYITPGVKGIVVTSGQSELRPQSATSHQNDIRKRKSLNREDGSELNKSRPKDALNECFHKVTPACIQALYNISTPDPNVAVSSNNSLGIYASDSIYFQGDLDIFFGNYTDLPTGTSPLVKSIDGGLVAPAHPPKSSYLAAAEFGEGDLDLQCAMPIIYPQTTTVYSVKAEDPHFIYGQGALNQFLDAVDGSFCQYLDQKNGSKSSLQCGVLQPPNVMSYSYGSPEYLFPAAWKDRQCMEYLKLGLQGVSLFFASGDGGVEGISVGNASVNCNRLYGYRVFMPNFPATCPWVTSVGATGIGLGRTVFDREESAFWWDANFYGGGGGGGFSLHFDAPNYQKDTLSQFFDNSDPPWAYFYNGNYENSTHGRYNRNGRGHPDISAVGSRVESCFAGTCGWVDGTSASTPIVAAIFNRVVEERLRAGKGPVGFVNPALYKNPGVLNDILSGSGNGWCNPDGGFQTVEGWDPVTGLGSPNYPKVLEYFMSLP